MQAAHHLRQRGRIGDDGVGIGRGLLRAHALLAQQIEHTLGPQGPAHGGRGLAAHLLDQIVIPAAAANRALRTQVIGNELEFLFYKIYC